MKSLVRDPQMLQFSQKVASGEASHGETSMGANLTNHFLPEGWHYQARGYKEVVHHVNGWALA